MLINYLIFPKLLAWIATTSMANVNLKLHSLIILSLLIIPLLLFYKVLLLTPIIDKDNSNQCQIMKSGELSWWMNYWVQGLETWKSHWRLKNLKKFSAWLALHNISCGGGFSSESSSFLHPHNLNTFTIF